MTSTIPDQPPPVPQDGPSAHELVIKDLQDREALGIDRYGTKLRPNNGRDNFIDAYQEVLDLVAYWRNLIEELRSYDPVHNMVMLLPDGRVAVQWNAHDRFPWVVVESVDGQPGTHADVRWLRDVDIPSSAIPLRPVLDAADNTELIEQLAAQEHDRWSRWQLHVHRFSKRNPDGSITIPAHLVDQYERQANTQYIDLDDSDKERDRKQVSRYLDVLKRIADAQRG